MAAKKLVISFPVEFEEATNPSTPGGQVVEVGNTKVKVTFGQPALSDVDASGKPTGQPLDINVVVARLLNAVPQELLDVVKRLEAE